jgi:hypothetical protein
MKRRTKLGLGAAACGCLVLGTAVASQGRFDTYSPARSGSMTDGPSPAWATPCLRRPPPSKRIIHERCARIKGRVIWVHSDKREGRRQVHLAVLSRFRVVQAELPLDPREEPSILSGVTAVGPLTETRDGGEEIVAVRVE